MKKAFVVILGVILLASCSKSTQYTQDLTGTWYIYKLTLNNVDRQDILNDSLGFDTIVFTSGGKYTENYIYALTDTVHKLGTWQFQNSYGQLLLTDTSRVQYTYTIFNLTGNSMELLRNGYDRYMRKK
jgi:hypothetical protein